MKYKEDGPLKAMASVADENHKLQPLKEIDPYQLLVECVKVGLE